MSTITIISGSPFTSSRLEGVLDLLSDALKEAGAKLNWIPVAAIPPEDLIYAKFNSPAIMEANQFIQNSDAVVVATPVYKASYSGVLKTFLDLIPESGLEHKVTLPVAVGGTIAHLLAIENSLKPVLSVLGARYQMQGIFICDTQVRRMETGGFIVDDEVKARVLHSAKELIQCMANRL
ncbi:NADPH-dependent FMN reductase [Paenibacillus tyrfis]|uniref:NADPH-dependent FMN reductase n=1 Tax=Paenibacillus tyrfis TaxID=1501230 RepID=UPI0020A22654|nr:NADPH-dependent FMN reductase [Paenibacillus tyrfis]MCP1311590.1 NADPH-dependent FMN reductase [Paenibacillus tyrfis]